MHLKNCINSLMGIPVQTDFWGFQLSSVPVPFFPFQSHCKEVSSVNNQFKIFWYGVILKNERPILVLSLLRFSKMTSELITFNHLRCHSSSTALGTRTGYWKPTQRDTDETSLSLGPELSEKFTINLVAKCKGKDVLASYMWTASILWNSIMQIMLNSANCMGRLFA